MGCGSSAPAGRGGEVFKKQPSKSQPSDPSQGGAAREKQSDPDEGLRQSHQLVSFLGRGGTGDTYLYKDRATGQEVAIKLIKRPIPKVITPNILREIRIQADLGEGHINVINAFEALLTDKHLALVMEFAACGSLTSYVADRWKVAQDGGLFLEEDEARYFFRQFIGAVEYCHLHSVAHRDLKLDNTLLSADKPPLVKLCDFGFAKDFDQDPKMFTHIGTPVYMSPELISSRNAEKGYDGKSVDVWASGILLLVMLVGTFPYDHIQNPDPNTTAAHEEVWEQQQQKPWSQLPHIEHAVHTKLTAECRDLLNRIFVLSEKERITVKQIKEHEWYTKPLAEQYEAAEADICRKQREIEGYTATRKINAALLKARNDSLQALLDAAGSRATPANPPREAPVMRVDLRESQILDNVADPGSTELPSLSEAEEYLAEPASHISQLPNGAV